MTGFCLWELDSSTMGEEYSFERFRQKLIERLPALPELRMKVVDPRLNLGNPVWVDDPDFDVDRHLHRVELPAPGARPELLEVLGKITDGQMDTGRPLWDMWVIEGLSEDDPDFSGPVALVHRFHHVLGDGVTALDILSRLCTGAAHPPEPAALDGVGTVSTRRIVLDGVARFAYRWWFAITEVLPATIAAVVTTILRIIRGNAMSGIFVAPGTPFNGTITDRRAIAYMQLDLADIKSVKRRFGVTINDVMLAVLSGALRQFLMKREALPEIPLVVGLPKSVFRADRAGRNHDSFVLTRLYTDIADPAERLRAVAAASSNAKAHSSAMRPTLMQDWLACAPRGLALFDRAMQLYNRRVERSGSRPLANTILSNVRGPNERCYVFGSAVRARYAFGPVLLGAGLNVTVMSLNGKLDVGLVSCSDLLPDVWDVADGLRPALNELLDTPA
jgi:diacylglycerol O-acyltransferase / wax synthase